MMKRNRFFILRLLGIVLSLCILTVLLPLPVSAQSAESTQATEEPEAGFNWNILWMILAVIAAVAIIVVMVVSRKYKIN